MENDLRYRGKKISVMGGGVSGRSLAVLAQKIGADVFVSDAKKPGGESLCLFDSQGIEWETGGHSDRFLDADEIIVSSGISHEAPILLRAVSMGIPVTGELDFVYPFLSGKIIAITGSNGKTTTASMAGHFLMKSGAASLTVGNIGDPIADAAFAKTDFLVIELSSFQLSAAKNFRCDAAAVTNLAPDHIDWHGSYENYAKAKAVIIKCLNGGDRVIFQKRDRAPLDISEGFGYPLSWERPCGVKGIYMDRGASCAFIIGADGEGPLQLLDFASVRLLGSHNLENAAMASAALFLLGQKIPQAEEISDFEPPRHRCAFVASCNGVKFVDDSKGTNVAASVAAMSSLDGDKVMILGGQGKGEDYGPLADALSKYAKGAVLMGSEKAKIAMALEAAGYKKYMIAETMEDAVEAAYRQASSGDTVLLSPACTSWDMYPDYGARGDHFSRIVKEIIERGA